MSAKNTRRRGQSRSGEGKTQSQQRREAKAKREAASVMSGGTGIGATTTANKPAPQAKTPRKVVKLDCAGFEITEENYASKAEGLMDPANGSAFGKLTTTKLRSIYALIMNVYARINTEGEYEQHKPDIQYLKVRMAYEAGREDSVKSFLAVTYLMKLVDGIASYEQFKLYCRYAEALVAYFKFFGGRDS